MANKAFNSFSQLRGVIKNDFEINEDNGRKKLEEIVAAMGFVNFKPSSYRDNIDGYAYDKDGRMYGFEVKVRNKKYSTYQIEEQKIDHMREKVDLLHLEEVYYVNVVFDTAYVWSLTMIELESTEPHIVRCPATTSGNFTQKVEKLVREIPTSAASYVHHFN